MLIAKTPQDLQGMLNDLARERGKVGLKLNPEKIKLKIKGVKDPIKVGDSIILLATQTSMYIWDSCRHLYRR